MPPEQQDQGEGQARKQAGESALGVGALDEHAHQEGRHDRRGDVGKHLLIVLQQGAEALDVRRPQRRDHNDYQGRNLTHTHQFLLVRLLIDLRVKVHGEEGGGRVQDGTEGRCQGREHGRQHESQHADRHEFQDHGGINHVGILDTWEKAASHHARDIEDDERAQRQEAGQHDADTALIDAFRAQDTLHKRLIISPEVDTQDGHTYQQAQPWRRGVSERTDEPGGDVAVLHQVREIGSASLGVADNHHHDGTHQEHQRLDEVRVDGRRKASRDGVRCRDDGKDHHEHPQFHRREQELENQSRRIQRTGSVQKDVADDADGREIVPRPAVEPPFQEFRNGENL